MKSWILKIFPDIFCFRNFRPKSLNKKKYEVFYDTILPSRGVFSRTYRAVIVDFLKDYMSKKEVISLIFFEVVLDNKRLFLRIFSNVFVGRNPFFSFPWSYFSKIVYFMPWDHEVLNISCKGYLIYFPSMPSLPKN